MKSIMSKFLPAVLFLVATTLVACPTADPGTTGKQGDNTADTTPPNLVSSLPVSQAKDVPLNLPEVRFVFSEAINQSTFKVQCIGFYADVEQCNLDLAALLGPAVWSGDRTVSFRPTKPMVPSANYGLIPIGTDLAGNALPDTRAKPDINDATQVWFTTVKAVTPPKVTTVALPIYGGGYILRKPGDDTAYTDTTINVGDRAAFPVFEFAYGYMAFKINSIPANATITAARLQVFLKKSSGDPFGTLGKLILERVDVPQIVEQPYSLSGDRGDANLPALPCTGCPIVLSDANIDQNVLGFVRADRASFKAGSQFRLRFTNALSNNNTSDYLDYFKNPILTITYETP